VAQEGRPLGLTELAEKSTLDKATVHRLATTLARDGYLVRRGGTREYELGLPVLDLGFSYLAGFDIRQLALPYLSSLAAGIGGSASLAVLAGADILYIERISSRRIQVGVDVRIGSRVPAHCTSMGKVMLASLSERDLASALEEIDFEAWTPNTIATAEALRGELDDARRRGYALNDEETTLGLRSVAAAVLDRFGAATAALNVAVPAAEFSVTELVDAAAGPVVEVAGAVSRHLGWRAPKTTEAAAQ
jgi:IclR family pca regulon transcriptional regulator